MTHPTKTRRLLHLINETNFSFIGPVYSPVHFEDELWTVHRDDNGDIVFHGIETNYRMSEDVFLALEPVARMIVIVEKVNKTKMPS